MPTSLYQPSREHSPMNSMIYLMTCPQCKSHNSLPYGEEPREGLMYHCTEEKCQTSFKLVEVEGGFVTANAGDDPEEVRRKVSGVEEDFFDRINTGRNHGTKISSISNPVGDNWMSKLFSALNGDGSWRKTISEEELLACPCEDCKEELERRRKNNCMAPDAPEGCSGFSQQEPDQVPSVPELMAEAAKTFRQRNALYGDSYKHFHEHMMTLFPEGLTLKTADEWSRFGILFYAIGKLVRYANNFSTGGHVDSAHDLGVYAFMLEELSRIGFKEKKL